MCCLLTVAAILGQADGHSVGVNVVCYPTEITWGDHVFVEYRIKNTGDKEIINYNSYSLDYWGVGLRASREEVSSDRVSQAKGSGYSGSYQKIAPGEEVVVGRDKIVLPPLEFYDDPFWRPIATQAMDVRLHFTLRLDGVGMESGVAQSTCDIKVKPPPPALLAALNELQKKKETFRKSEGPGSKRTGKKNGPQPLSIHPLCDYHSSWTGPETQVIDELVALQDKMVPGTLRNSVEYFQLMKRLAPREGHEDVTSQDDIDKVVELLAGLESMEADALNGWTMHSLYEWINWLPNDSPSRKLFIQTARKLYPDNAWFKRLQVR